MHYLSIFFLKGRLMLHGLFTFLANIYSKAKHPGMKWLCVITAIVLGGLYINSSLNNAFIEEEITTIIENTDTPDMETPDILSEPEDTVVLIMGMDSIGSGVVISEDGIILTAGHILERGFPLIVTFYNEIEYTEFESLYVDNDADVGLFKIKGITQLPYLSFSDSNEVMVGDFLWGIGNPYGYTNWYCSGVMSKKSEKGIMYLSMPLNPGNSGSPILNKDNEIVGICTKGILLGNNMGCGHTSNICAAIVTKYRILFDYN